MRYWVIEHPKKGILTDVPGDRDDKFHWQWSQPNTDERNKRFFTYGSAKRMADQITGAEPKGVKF